VLYDGDCSHRHKGHPGMMVAGQMLENDPTTISFP